MANRSIGLGDLDLEDLVLVVRAALAHVLVQEGPHVDLAPQQLLLDLLGLAVGGARFLVEAGYHVLLGVGRGAAPERGRLSEEHSVLFLETLVLRELLIVFVPDRLELLPFLTIFIHLVLKLRFEPLDDALEFLDLRLLEVHRLELVCRRLQLRDLLLVHALHALAKLVECRFVQRHLLAAVALLLFELDRLTLARGSCAALSCHSRDAAHRTVVLHQGGAHGARH